MTNSAKIRQLDDTALAEFILWLLKGDGEPEGYEYHCENCPAGNCTNFEPEEQCCFATLMIWLGKEEEESEMSKMKEVAELLGVEIGEEFEITNYSCVYRITNQHIENRTRGSECWYETNGEAFYSVLTGRSTIIKKPWRPKKGENYWCATYCGASAGEWQGGMSDLAYYAIGNCFKTEEEAEAHKEEVLARLKKIYDEGNPLIGADEWRDKE